MYSAQSSRLVLNPYLSVDLESFQPHFYSFFFNADFPSQYSLSQPHRRDKGQRHNVDDEEKKWRSESIGIHYLITLHLHLKQTPMSHWQIFASSSPSLQHTQELLLRYNCNCYRLFVPAEMKKHWANTKNILDNASWSMYQQCLVEKSGIKLYLIRKAR